MRYLLVLFAFLWISPTSLGALIRFDFTATATAVTTFPVTPGIQVGDELSGSFTLDLSTPATLTEESRVEYDNSLVDFHMTVGGYEIQIEPNPPFDVSGSIIVIDIPNTDQSFFIVDLFAQSNVVDLFSVVGVGFEFSDSTGQGFSNLQLPTDLSGIETQLLGLSLQASGVPAIAEFEITSIQSTVVPLPATAWLLLSSLGLLGFARKKRVT